MLDPNTKNPRFPDQKAYDTQADDPWVIEAAAELASMIYGLDPDYDQKLEENKFLKEFKFVDKDLRFINKEGHYVDLEGRLVNEDGRFIAYRTEKGKDNKDSEQLYFVNKDGDEVVAVTGEDGEEEWVKASLKERKPFLDEADNPIVLDDKKAETTTETKDVDAEEATASKASTTKKKRKTTKTA